MLTYSKGWGGLFLVLRFAGTSWPHGIMPGLLSACLGLALGLVRELDDVIVDEDAFVKNPYPYQLFAYLVGFVLIFRTNFGYTRYWEALDAVQRMGAKWLDGACMAIAFDAKGDASSPYLQPSVAPSEGEADQVTRARTASALDLNRAREEGGDAAQSMGLEHEAFFVEIAHLFSLMHALALQHLRCDMDLGNLQSGSLPRLSLLGSAPHISSSHNKLTDFTTKGHRKASFHLRLKVLGGLLKEELRALATDSLGQPVPSAARVAMVESWIMRRLIARQKYEPAGDMCKTAPPILSRMVQVISDGNLGFSQAAKVAETPFPFPYHNIISLFLWIFAFTAPFVVNAKVMQVHARFVVNFIAVWSYFSLAEVGDNLEDPYMPYDPNDLPLEAMHHSYNARLLAFGVVPQPSPGEKPCVTRM